MCKIDQELEGTDESRGSWEVGAMGRGPGKKKRLASADQMDIPAAKGHRIQNSGALREI
jgi:hypothetical protein